MREDDRLAFEMMLKEQRRLAFNRFLEKQRLDYLERERTRAFMANMATGTSTLTGTISFDFETTDTTAGATAVWDSTAGEYVIQVPHYHWPYDIQGHLDKLGLDLTDEINHEGENMKKRLYRLYGVNRRDGRFLDKMFIGVYDNDDALASALVANANEIKTALGEPDDCEFKLTAIMTFDVISKD